MDLSSDVQDMLLRLACALAGKLAERLLDSVIGRVRAEVVGDDFHGIMQRVVVDAVQAGPLEIWKGLDDDTLAHCMHVLSDVLSLDDVVATVVDVALAAERSSSDAVAAIRAQMVQHGYDPETIPDFDAGLTATLLHLAKAIREEAKRPGSPLHNAFAVNRFDRIEDGVEHLKGTVEALRDSVTGHGDQAQANSLASWAGAVLGGSAGSLWLQTELVAYRTRAAGEVESYLEMVEEALREGDAARAHEQLVALQVDDLLWQSASVLTKARARRTECRIWLAKGDVAQAKEALAKARRLAASPEEEVLLEALVARSERGPAAALEIAGACATTEGIHLRAQLCLSLGQLDDAQRALESIDQVAVSPETHRLWALLHALRGHRDAALNEASLAEAGASRWTAVRFSVAVVHYLAALSPTVLPTHLPQWPWPVEPEDVRLDSDSLAALRRASEESASLAAGAPDCDRATLRVWQIAAEACDPEGKNLASATCRSVLSDDPCNPGAIAWAVGRGLDADQGPSEVALRARLCSDTASLDDVLSLVWLLHGQGKTGDGLEVLNGASRIFHSAGKDNLRIRWEVILLLCMGRPEAALAALGEHGEDPELLDALLATMGTLGRDSENWAGKFTTRVETLYASTGHPRYLMAVCDLMAARENWAYVAERAESLVASVPTFAALDLAARSLYHTKQYARCAERVGALGHLVPSSSEGSALRRLRVQSLQRTGRVQLAASEMAELTESDPSPTNLMLQMGLQVIRGDISGMLSSARELAAHHDLPVSTRLALADNVRTRDPELARNVWSAAIREEVPDEAAPMALLQAFQLDREEEAGSLLPQVDQISEKPDGPVKKLSLDEVRRLVAAQRERIHDLDQSYRAGRLPIHVLSAELRHPLVWTFHHKPAQQAADPAPLIQPAVFVRHAARPKMGAMLGERIGQPFRPDVTAVLTAHHLGILPAVEQCFGTIWLSQSLIPSLLHMHEMLAAPQPGRFRYMREILSGVDRGRILVCDGYAAPDADDSDGIIHLLDPEYALLVRQAKDHDGYALGFWPPAVISEHPESWPDDGMPLALSECTVNCSALLEVLRTQCGMNRHRLAAARRRLGTEGEKTPTSVRPDRGSRLYVVGAVAVMLEQADLLREVCKYFTVCISNAQYRRMRQEMEDQSERVQAQEWLDRLVQYLSAGVERDVYRFLPESASVTEDMRQSSELDLACLHDAINASGSSAGALWVDDRYANGFTHAGPDSIVVSVDDVLEALRATGTVDESTYFDSLHTLRAGNFRFIPVSADEILHWLKESVVTEYRVVESQELCTLRRYVAACLDLEASRDTIGTRSPAYPHGELPFIIQVKHEVSEALASIWSDPEWDEEKARAYADWLYDSLLVPIGAAKVVTQPSLARDVHAGTADLNLLELLAPGLISADVGQKLSPPRRAKYFEWLQDRYLRDHSATDPAAVQEAARWFAEFVDSTLDETRGSTKHGAVLWLLATMYEEIPTPVREEIERNKQVARRFSAAMVKVGHWEFLFQDFVAAIEKCVNGERGQAVPEGEEHVVEFAPTGEDTLFVLTQQDVSEEAGHTVFFEQAPLLLRSHAARRAVLRSHRTEWFDCREEDAEVVIAAIAEAEPSWERLHLLDEWRSTSATGFYANLREQLALYQSLDKVVLLPHRPQALLWHLRLGTMRKDEPFTVMLDDASRLLDASGLLIEDVGLHETIFRVASLPVALSPAILDAVDKASPAERRRLFRLLSKRADSPIYRVQVARLLLRYREECASYARLARWALVRALGPSGRVEFLAYKSLLSWTVHALHRLAETRSWQSAELYAAGWIHGHHLWHLLRSLGCPADWIYQAFADRAMRVAAVDHMDSRFTLPSDAAHPDSLTWPVFVATAASYVLDDGSPDALGEGTWRTIQGQTTLELGGKRYPHFALWRDITLAQNALGSFLWKNPVSTMADLGVSLETEDTFSNTEDLVSSLADQLTAEGSDIGSVLSTLAMIVGELPVPDRCAAALTTGLCHIEWHDYLERGDDLGLLAYSFATQQSRLLRSAELWSHLKAEWLRAVRKWAEGNAAGDAWQGVSSVLFPLACAHPSEVPSVVLAGLLMELVVGNTAVVQSVADQLRRLVQTLCDILPAELARPLWPVLLRFRALA